MRVSDVFQSVIASYNEWDDVLANPNWARGDTWVSWTRREPGTLEHEMRFRDLVGLVNERQYTFQVTDDGSILQLYYRFEPNGVGLSHARLAFYCSGLRLDERDESTLNTGVWPSVDSHGIRADEGSGEVVEDRTVGWFRIDYDPLTVAPGVNHPPCHLHFSGFPDARLIVNGVPTPRQFVEFVISSFYPEVYRQKRLSEQTVSNASTRNWVFREPHRMTELNADGFAVESEPMYQLLCHFRVPGKV